MAALSFIDLSSDKIEPVLILAGASLAGIWLWQHLSKSNAAAAQQNAAASADAGFLNQVASLQALQQFFGAQQQAPQTTYTAPGTTGSGTKTTTGTGTGSSLGGTTATGSGT